MRLLGKDVDVTAGRVQGDCGRQMGPLKPWVRTAQRFWDQLSMSLPLLRTIYTSVFSFRQPEPNPVPVSSRGQCQDLADQQPWRP